MFQVYLKVIVMAIIAYFFVLFLDAHLEEGWLIIALQKQGIEEIAEVFYAGLDTSGKLYISEKRSAQEREGQHGIE